MIQLSSIIYYPIKACPGFETDSSNVELMGLQYDRRMMLVTPDGEFQTQREYPKLARVPPKQSDTTVTLSAPSFDSIQFDIKRSGATSPVNIWKSKGIQAVDQGDETAGWFLDWLRTTVRLVHIADGFKRKVSPDYAGTENDQTSLANGYPILIISEESLSDLNSRMETSVPMNRFRPNIVVKGCEPFAEDTWKRIKIRKVEMALVKPCGRCVVTPIDKDTLEKSKEPLKTLNKFRKHELGAIFGMNVIPLNEGRLELGMSVQVI